MNTRLQQLIFLVITVNLIFTLSGIFVTILPVLVVGLATLPVLVPLVLVSAYTTTTLVYILYGQSDRHLEQRLQRTLSSSEINSNSKSNFDSKTRTPSNPFKCLNKKWKLPYLYVPLHPVKVLKVWKVALESTIGNLVDPLGVKVVWFMVGEKLESMRVGSGVGERKEKVGGKIIKGVSYHQHERHRTVDLDIFMSKNGNTNNELNPVVIFIYGGAWNSGDKSLYEPVARMLQQKGFVVVIPNYTLYPHGKIERMISDVQSAIAWTQDNISQYGGNPDNVYVIGHSAGSHLSILSLLCHTLRDFYTILHPNVFLHVHKHIIESNGSRGMKETDIVEEEVHLETSFPYLKDDEKIDVRIKRLKGLILLSGVYDIPAQLQFEKNRGVDEVSGLKRANGITHANMLLRSPNMLLSTLLASNRKDLKDMVNNELPERIFIVHGELDTTVPVSQSVNLYDLLHKLRTDGLELWIPRMNHTQPVAGIMTEGPFLDKIVQYMQST